MHVRRFTLALKVILSSVLLAACGGGGSGGGNGQAPTATLTAPANFADNLTGTITLSATANDDVAVANVEFQVDGKTLLTTSNGPLYQTALNTSSYTSGQHVVRARSRDGAGNVSAWASATVRFGGAVEVPAGFTKTEAWTTGLVLATAMAQAPDGRLFVAEQGGALRIVKNNVLLTTPFLQLGVDSTDERGLIGVALHPDFANNGYVYVHYTTGEGGTHNRVQRFQAIPPSNDVVSAGSGLALVDLPALGATNHNGGAIHFSADGKLLVGVGDNAVGANSQNLNNPLGKLLRFNDDLSIPGDNPFAGSSTGLGRAIWAYGLRNPFTFAVQPGTGRIHINDVGEGTWEEVDLGAAGANYGWPASEGPQNVTTSLTGPLFTYKHSAATPVPGSGPGGFFTGNVIAGGTFYPISGASAVFPAEYLGQYFFADSGSRFVARLDAANGNTAYAFASVAGNPVDILVGLDGALYVLTRTAITRISAP